MWLQGTPRPTWQISAWGHRKSKRHRSGNFLLAASTLATVCEAAGPELRVKGRILAKWMWSWASTSKAGVRHNLCLKTRVTLPTSLVVVHLLRWVIAVLLGKAELLSLSSCFQIQTAIKKWPFRQVLLALTKPSHLGWGPRKLQNGTEHKTHFLSLRSIPMLTVWN